MQLYPIIGNIIAKQRHSVTPAGPGGGLHAPLRLSPPPPFAGERGLFRSCRPTGLVDRHSFSLISPKARPSLESRLKGSAGSGRATPRPGRRGCPGRPERSPGTRAVGGAAPCPSPWTVPTHQSAPTHDRGSQGRRSAPTWDPVAQVNSRESRARGRARLGQGWEQVDTR